MEGVMAINWYLWRSRDEVKANRAESAWQRIQDRPTELVILRAGVELPAQTVRVEVYTSNSEKELDYLGRINTNAAIVFGVYDHPEEVDTDIERTDRFEFGGDVYEVTHAIYADGEVQAYARSIG